jgi:hypothetical protein
VSFNLTIQIDPHAVLGVEAGASLLEIRDAYRRKAKQHHPDVGGDEWAFRILSQAYEILSTARVVQATEAEFRTRPTAEHPSPRSAGAGAYTHAQAAHHAGPSGAAGPFGAGPRTRDETVRPGVSDAVSDPTRVVDIEKLWVRYEVDHLWLMHEGKSDDRFLSCCLNISWPDPELASRAASIPGADEILLDLKEAFEEVHIHTPVVNSSCQIEDHKFQGWLSYSSTQLVWKAFNKLHEELNARGLSVKQWTRDLIIPRDWH